MMANLSFKTQSFFLPNYTFEELDLAAPLSGRCVKRRAREKLLIKESRAQYRSVNPRYPEFDGNVPGTVIDL